MLSWVWQWRSLFKQWNLQLPTRLGRKPLSTRWTKWTSLAPISMTNVSLLLYSNLSTILFERWTLHFTWTLCLSCEFPWIKMWIRYFYNLLSILTTYRTIILICLDVGTCTDNDCLHGDCGSNNTCICHHLWFGERCDQATCFPPDGCLNGGHCVSPGHCSCAAGYRGLRCEEGTHASMVLWLCTE